MAAVDPTKGCGLDGIAYGGDYNPEQWPEEVWQEDVRLMRAAGVNLVTVNVFGWALLEPAEGRYEFGWLDRAMDLLHANGIRVDLATASASPPPWFSRAYPQTLPVTADGHRLYPGARQAFCPSSPIYRAHAVALTERIAGRYADHPALAMWHVHNEYGCHNPRCYCDVSAEAFQGWLRERYATIDALNEAWGTAFWSQRYGDWAEILPPRQAPTFINPTQRLDFDRFGSDQFLACMRAETAVLRRLTPDTPITTNYLPHPFRAIDYWSWAGEVDVVAIDHYLRVARADPEVDLSLSADMARSLGGGAPWLLMEHSTSAVNWQPRNRAKRPGEMRRNSLAHLARGADGVMFFQWRQSRAGAEKFHSAMVPHAGTETKVWREVVELGALLGRLSEVKGSRVAADVAVVFDWPAWWAGDQDAHPTTDARYTEAVRALHGSLWRAGVAVDLVPPSADLSRYRLVLVPGLYLVSDADASNIAGYVAGGGHALVTYFSGIVDEHDHVRLGGYPGAFGELLGVWTEEFHPLLKDEQVRLDDGAVGRVWTEHLHPRGAQVIAAYEDGPLPGVPAITRNAHGAGEAWYLATALSGDDLDAFLARLCEGAGVTPTADAPPGVEAVRRIGDSGSYLFLINHTDHPVTVAARGTDLVGGAAVSGTVDLPSGGVAVVREEPLAA
jgi:beta-galactosidase